MERFILLFIVMLIFSTFILLSNVIGNNNLLASISGTIPNATLGTTPSSTLGTIPNATPNTAQGTISSATLDTTSYICSLITIYDNIKRKYKMDEWKYDTLKKLESDQAIITALKNNLVSEDTLGWMIFNRFFNIKYAQIIIYEIFKDITAITVQEKQKMADILKKYGANSNVDNITNYNDKLEYINSTVKQIMLKYNYMIPYDFHLFITCAREIFYYILKNIAQNIRDIILSLFIKEGDNFNKYFNKEFNLNDLIKKNLLTIRDILIKCKALETTINYFIYLIYHILKNDPGPDNIWKYIMPLQDDVSIFQNKLDIPIAELVPQKWYDEYQYMVIIVK